MTDTEDLRAWLILLRTPGLTPRNLREGLVARGSASALLGWLTRHESSLKPEGRDWLAQPDEAALAADLAWVKGADDQRLLLCTEEDFPP